MKKLSLSFLLFLVVHNIFAQVANDDDLPTGNANIPCTFTAMVDVGGETNICPGTTVSLSTPGVAGYTFQWLFNDEIIPGATSNVYHAGSQGLYAVIVYTRGCRGESLPVEVTVKDAASFNPFPEEIDICGPETVLEAGDGYVSYLWNNNSVENNLTVTESGSYSVQVLDNQGCFFSDQVSVSVIDFAVDQNELVVCAGTPINLTVSGSAVNHGYECYWIGLGVSQSGYSISSTSNSSSYYFASITDGQGICIDTVTVNVQPISNTLLQVSSCDSYIWNGNTYTQSGTYTFLTNAANGCDSIVVMDLQINASYQQVLEISACQQFTFNNIEFNQTGTYTFNYNASNGCDSSVILHLTIHQPTSSYNNVFSCGPYEWNGISYDESGNYTYSTVNEFGCDSIAILHLTVNNTTYSTTEIVSNQPYYWNGNLYDQTGNYVFVSTNQAGCDSLAILDLFILAPLDCSISSSNSSICVGNSVVLSAPTYTEPNELPGVPSRTNQTNRFSIRYTYLWSTGDTTSTITMQPSVTTTYTVTISDGYSTCTGSYTVVVNQPSYNEETVSVCQWSSYNWNGQIYSASGDYTYISTNAAGCDSIALLHLSINAASSSETTATACGTFSWNGTVYSASGDYTYTATNAAGCDSVAVLHLNIAGNVALIHETASACNQYSWYGSLYNSTGVYTHITANPSGCDTTYILHLQLLYAPSTPGNIQVQSISNCNNRYLLSVSSVSGAISYVWSVPAGMSILGGQGTSSIVVSVNSFHQLSCNNRTVCVAAVNSCGSSASSCMNWQNNNHHQHQSGNNNDNDDDDDGHGSHNTNCDKLSLDFYTYPNPATQFVSVVSNEAKIDRLELIDAKGKVLIRTNQVRQIPVSHLASGEYFIRIYTNKGVRSKGMYIIR